MMTQENQPGSPIETGGELSPEAQAVKDAETMAGLYARRAAEAAAEAAAQPQKDAAINAAQRALEESHAWDDVEQQRRGFN